MLGRILVQGGRGGRPILLRRWASRIASELSEHEELTGSDLLKAHSKSQLDSYEGAVTPGAVAFVLQKTRKPAEAVTLFQWASKQPGFTHDETTASALLGVYVKARLFKEACRMLLSDDLRHICCRSSLAFSTLVSGYCYIGNMEAAILLLKEMERLGMVMDIPLHNVILRGFCRAGKVDEAVDHYRKMVANKEADFSSHSFVISEMCKAGRVQEAVDVMYAMGDEGMYKPDSNMFNSIIGELCRLKKLDVANMLVGQMIDRGCLPNASTYKSLVVGCFKSGKLVQASRLMQQMMDMGCIPDLDILNGVIEQLCKIHRVDDAKDLLDQMYLSSRLCRPDIRTHKAFLTGLCKEIRLDEAQRYLQKIIATGCLPDAETYGILIRALCRDSRVVEAHRIFSEMLGRGCVPDDETYNLLIAGHCEARKLSASYFLVKQMLDKGLSPDPGTAETMIHLLERRGKMIEAKDIAKRLGS